MSAGRFITFEGGEGTGKSTQAQLLSERLGALGLTVHTTREPGGSKGAELLRRILLSGAVRSLGPAAEAMLFYAAREDHLETLIRPALKRGDWVISDRFSDSTRVYQQVDGRLPDGLLDALERTVVATTKPDLTIILDVPTDLALARARAVTEAEGRSPDRFESEGTETHVRIADSFQELAREQPDRCVLVDASGDAETVADAVFGIVENRLGVAFPGKLATIKGPAGRPDTPTSQSNTSQTQRVRG